MIPKKNGDFLRKLPPVKPAPRRNKPLALPALANNSIKQN
jgi:hypothetical protein